MSDIASAVVESCVRGANIGGTAVRPVAIGAKAVGNVRFSPLRRPDDLDGRRDRCGLGRTLVRRRRFTHSPSYLYLRHLSLLAYLDATPQKVSDIIMY